MLRYLLPALLLAACGRAEDTKNVPAYVCYPVEAGAMSSSDAGESCQEKAPPGCALVDISQTTGPGPTWCCVDVTASKLLCCDLP